MLPWNLGFRRESRRKNKQYTNYMELIVGNGVTLIGRTGRKEKCD